MSETLNYILFFERKDKEKPYFLFSISKDGIIESQLGPIKTIHAVLPKEVADTISEILFYSYDKQKHEGG